MKPEGRGAGSVRIKLQYVVSDYKALALWVSEDLRM